jgi:hypothetical protein
MANPSCGLHDKHWCHARNPPSKKKGAVMPRASMATMRLRSMCDAVVFVSDEVDAVVIGNSMCSYSSEKGRG